MNKSEQLIACLEGEIAKRDAELAACCVAVENCELFRARVAELEERNESLEFHAKHNYELANKAANELAAIKAQGVAFNPDDIRIDTYRAGEHSCFLHTNETAVRITHLPTGAYVESKDERSVHRNKQKCLDMLPAAIEAKAQGVVMPDVNAAAKALCNRHAMICGVDADDQWKQYSQDFIADAETVLANARLNAALVQQVSVPDEMRSLAQRLREYNQNPHHINPMSEAFHILVADAANAISTACVPKEIAAAITWSEHLLFECGALTSTRAPSVHVYNKTFAAVNEARAMLAAAPAAPAADAWIPVSERLPDVPDGDEREVIVCVKRAHNGQSYSFSARYLNNFPLHSDYEDEPMIVTGWHDVKEHAEYYEWYSPLIDSSSGDEVTHWMPLPAANSAKGVV